MARRLRLRTFRKLAENAENAARTFSLDVFAENARDGRERCQDVFAREHSVARTARGDSALMGDVGRYAAAQRRQIASPDVGCDDCTTT